MHRQIIIGALLACTLVPAVAAAQDDPWAVKRSGFDPRVVAKYKAMLNRRPTDSHAFKRLVKLYRQHRSMGQLIGEYQSLARAKPASYAYQLILGHLNRRAGSYKPAVNHYRKAAKLRPKNPVPHAALGGIHARLNEGKQATEAYNKALELTRQRRGRASKKRQMRYLKRLAQIAVNNRQNKEASKYYKQLLALAPKNMRLRLEMARAMALGGMGQEALKHLTVVLKSTGDSARKAQLYKEIGDVHHKLEDVKSAVATYRKAMALTIRGHWLRRELTERIIQIYREKEMLGKLIAEYEKRWKVRGQFEWEVLGRLYQEVGNETRALAAYRAALKKAPYAVRTRLALISLLDRSGKPEEVLEEYRKLARYAPGEPRYRLKLAKKLYEVGKHKEAVATLDRLGRAFPGDASVHSILRDLYNGWGYYKRAKAEAHNLVRIEPKDPDYLIALGEQFYTEGKKRKALAVWKRLLRVIPVRHKAYAKLAEVYAQHKMDQQAIALFRKAIKLSPKTIDYHQGLAHLFESKRMHGDAVKSWEAVMKLAKAAKNRRVLRKSRRKLIDVMRRAYSLRGRIRLVAIRFKGPSPDLDDGFFLALGYLKLNDLKSATRIYQRVVELWPNNIEAMGDLVKVYVTQRKLKQAVALLRVLAVKDKAGQRDHYLKISNLLLYLGKDAEALAYANRAKDPKNPRSFEKMGRVFEMKGDYKRARMEYEKAIKLSKQLTRRPLISSLFALARLESREGRPNKAEELYRKVIVKASNPDQIDKAFDLVVNISSYLGTMTVLEKEISPLAVTSTNAKAYRKLLVRIYKRRVPVLIDQARRGDAATRAAARKELARIGARGLSPLLEELAVATGTAMIRYLGYLGNPNAVNPLLRIAEKKHEKVITIYAQRRSRSSRRYRYRYRRRRYGYPRWNISQAGTGTIGRRVQATVALGRISSPRASEGLIRLLDNKETRLRDAASWALSRVARRSEKGTRQKVSRTMFLGLGDSDSTVQMMSCAGLAMLRDPALRPVLEEVMKDDRRHTRVRAACAWGLGVQGDKRSVPALVEVLQGGDGELQRCAAWSLGALGDAAAVDPLVRSLWTKRDRVRRAILWALGRITARAGPLKGARVPDVVLKNNRLDADDFLRRLTTSLDDLGGAARAKNMVRVIEARGEAIARGVRVALGRHRDVVLRVLRDLDAGGDRVSLGPLTSGRGLLSAPEQARLDRAVEKACATLEPALGRLRGHRDPLVRTRSLAVLTRLARPGLEAHLRRALKDASWSVRVGALGAATRAHRSKTITTAQALTLVKPSLKSAHWREREAAARTLADLGHRSVVPALAVAAKDSNAFVREASMAGLGRTGGARAVALLRSARKDDVLEVRQAACRALVRLRAPGSGTCGAMDKGR